MASTGSKGHWAPAARARALLKKYGININDAANGIPMGHPVPHNFTHTGAFNRMVEIRLVNIVKNMTQKGYGRKAIRRALRRELRKIANEVIEKTR